MNTVLMEELVLPISKQPKVRAHRVAQKGRTNIQNGEGNHKEINEGIIRETNEEINGETNSRINHQD